MTNMLDSQNYPSMFWAPGGERAMDGASQQVALLDTEIEPHISVHRPAFSRLGAIIKRGEDLAVGCSILILFSWLFFLIAVAIKLVLCIGQQIDWKEVVFQRMSGF